MSSKGKIGIGILVLVIIVGAGLAFSSKSQLFSGRFNDRDARGGRGGGDGRGGDRGSYGRGGGSDGGPVTQEIGPDLAVLTIEPSYVTYEAAPGKYANYYRYNVKFKNVGKTLPAKYDWKIFLNNQEYTKLALNTLPSNWPYYAFDVLNTVACPSFNVFTPSIQVSLDPGNQIKEVNENNNIMISKPVDQFGGSCYNGISGTQWLQRCQMAIMLDKAGSGNPLQPIGQPVTFPDIKDPACKKAAESLAAQGVISGYTDGTFQGNKNVNRAEAAKLLGYVIKSGFPAAMNGYPDVPASAWFSSYVNTLLAAGKVKGKADLVGFTDGYYRPEALSLTSWFQAMIDMLK